MTTFATDEDGVWDLMVRLVDDSVRRCETGGLSFADSFVAAGGESCLDCTDDEPTSLGKTSMNHLSRCWMVVLLPSTLAFLSAISLDSAWADGPAAGDHSRPNIVLIVVDDLGWNDVGYHNPEMHTPHIDELVRQNVELNRFYVAPQCSPTRAGLLTGRYPHRFGMLDHVISPTQTDGLPESETTIAEMLADAGYQHRAMMGKWHLGLRSKLFHPMNHGFTEFYGHYNGAIDYFRRVRRGEPDWHRNDQSIVESGYSTELLTEEATGFIKRNSAGESPYFLYLAYNSPHSPMQALQGDLDIEGFDKSQGRIASDDARLAKREGDPDYGRSGTGNSLRQTFRANVRALDRGIGRVMESIERSGESDDTLVIFASDNGGVPSHGGSNVPLRGNKFEIYEGGVRVVAALRWPAVFPKPLVNEDTLAYIDVWPTIAKVAGVQDFDQPIDGENMLPKLMEESAAWSRTLYLRESGVIHGEWKLVATDKKRNQPAKPPELFHLRHDPWEETDLANQKPAKVRELLKLAKTFRELKGPAAESKYDGPWPPKNWELPEEPSSKLQDR